VKLFTFLARFGLKRGFKFYLVARKCDRDPHLLRSWETHYRALASRELRENDKQNAHAHLAFAEMLSTAHDQIVLHRKPRRPLVTRRNQRINKRLRELHRNNGKKKASTRRSR
jgi:hypothetical protein